MAGLTDALLPASGPVRAISLLDRTPEATQSTFASEVVTCEYGGRTVQLFCKYSMPHTNPAWHRAFGHRRGVAFEADVYERVLGPLKVQVPALRGIYRSQSPEETWLVIDYLADAVKLNKAPEFITDAATWIGTFHAKAERRVSRPEFSFLPRYDCGYYRGWSTRVKRYTERAGLGGRWLDRLCSRYDDAVETLLAAPLSVVHGEFYPANILVRKRRVRPVDWETAAVACGEIDIASLTEGWSASLTRACDRAYRLARWPRGAPPGFRRRLEAARFYLTMRWAGEPSHWTDEDGRAFYSSQVRALAEQMGLN